jgi:hypothetical protein
VVELAPKVVCEVSRADLVEALAVAFPFRAAHLLWETEVPI